MRPSRQPTSHPSCQPTMQPSGQPTNEPSRQPSRFLFYFVIVCIKLFFFHPFSTHYLFLCSSFSVIHHLISMFRTFVFCLQSTIKATLWTAHNGTYRTTIHETVSSTHVTSFMSTVRYTHTTTHHPTFESTKQVSMLCCDCLCASKKVFNRWPYCSHFVFVFFFFCNFHVSCTCFLFSVNHQSNPHNNQPWNLQDNHP